MKRVLLFLSFSFLISNFSIAQWNQKGIDIDGEASLDRSGWSVSMPDINTVAIGSMYNDGNGSDAGHVRVYEWNGSSWIQKGSDIDGESSGDNSGNSISMPDNNTIAIGGRFADGSSADMGHVRVYEWDGSSWIQKGNDIDGEAASDLFGWYVSMPDPNTMAVSSAYNSGSAFYAGHVRIYDWNGSAWIQRGIDIDGEAAEDQSGFMISMPDINTVCIGAWLNDGNGTDSGHARIYEWNGSAWVQKGLDIDGENADDRSGWSVSMPDNNTVAVGAIYNDDNGNNAGHVRVYEWTGSAWTQKGMDLDGEAADDQFGFGLSMPDANTIAIGANLNDGNGTDAGHVRIYEWNGSSWIQKGIDIDGEAAGDQSGFFGVSMPDPHHVAIGAPYNGSNSQGHVRVFEYCTQTITPLCQDINLYLDGTGNATLNASDIDNGSSVTCGTLNLSASQTAFDCNDMFTTPANKMVITGVIDGPLTGGIPKAVELYVLDDIADLSEYGIGSANNGGGSDGEEFTLSGTATAGDYIYIATEATEFTNFFGFAPDFTDGTGPNINGDDAVELYFQGAVIDVFGDINQSGSGQPWDYMDGWAYRNASTGPDGTTFTLANWTFSGINALDGETTNGAAATPFPDGTYTYTPTPAPQAITLTVDDGNGNSDNCVANVTVLDTISPVPDIANLADVNDVCSVTPTAPTATDNCSGSLTGVPDVTFPITVQGTTIVTWTYTDESGNTKQQQQNVILTDATDPTASNPSAVVVECIADVPATDITVVTDEADNCTASPVVAFVSDVSDGNTCPEVITRTYSVSDDAGNQISVTQTITVGDLTDPVPDNSTLTDVTAECQSSPTAPTATDNCDGALTATPDVTFPITTVGTTTVTWTYTDACGNTATQTQDVIITEIDNSVTVSGITITATASGYQYQWVDCDNSNQAITGETGQSFTPTSNGNYAVEITDGTCTVTSACEAITTVGVMENSFGSEISVYPNPTDGEITINLGANYNNITIEVKDITGQLIQNNTYESAENVSLNINGADGLYLINIRSENGENAMLRIVKK